MSVQEQLRQLPSVDDLLGRAAQLLERYPRTLVVTEIRRILDEHRELIRGGADVERLTEIDVARRLASLEDSSLFRVINATGVVLHTNLGRAPLPAMPSVEGYSNLEYDLAAGKRGKRDSHIAGALERLLDAPAIAVNNNAAAVYLVLNTLAAGEEVIVSRGELIEIGDGFRIPEIMRASGAILREVGTTNRTTIEDYRSAIGERTRLLMRVHPSNFRIEGFTARPMLRELIELAHASRVPLYEDLGSGSVVDLRAVGIHEPLVQESLRAGANVVSFSGDKLLGGPQAGIIAGQRSWIARIRSNPMYRAMRLDKLVLTALDRTLRSLLLERWENLPALRMIRESADSIRVRADRMAANLAGIGAEVIAGESIIGGGATPQQTLPTWLLAISGHAVTMERRLRQSTPPVISRIESDRLVLDLRTVLPGDEAELTAAIQALSR